MIHKKITRTLLITLLMFVPCAHISVAHAMGQPPAGQFGPDMLSPEDLQAMEKAVEDQRAKMSPEERAQFDNDVEQLTKELEAMKPEELESFMNTVLFGQPAPEEFPQEIAPAPTPTTPVVAPKPEPAKPQKPRKKQDEALSRIDGIIRYTNSFLNKMAIVEFGSPNKIKKWAEQGKIKKRSRTNT